jgi:tetratricopeptide (TPR) repeat protein
MVRTYVIFFVVGMVWGNLLLCSQVEDTPESLREKADCLLAEQKHVEAQECFLLAIDKLLQREALEEMCRGEKEAVESFFVDYEEAVQSSDNSKAFLEKVHKTFEKHPQYLSLLYYAAASQANLGNLHGFFEDFFRAVSTRPASFMALKFVGVLHLRLYESSADEAKRFFHRNEAVKAFKMAFSKEPRDISLVMKLLFVLPEEEQRLLVKEVCADMVKSASAPRRRDCLYIIEVAMSLSLYEEAKLLLDKARSWYEYSRMLNEIAQELDGVSPSKIPNCAAR